MKQWITGIAAIGLAVAALAVALKPKQAKVGVVDNAVLMTHFSEAVSANAALEDLEKGWRANLKIIQDSIQATMDLLSRDYAHAKEVDRQRMGESLNRWNAEYNRYQSAVANMRIEKQKEILNPVLEKVNAFVKNWAREKGYGVILGTGNGGVILSVSDAQNVTPLIVADLNRLYAGKEASKPEAKPAEAPAASSSAPDSTAAGKNVPVAAAAR